jgi:hypothetical protein
MYKQTDVQGATWHLHIHSQRLKILTVTREKRKDLSYIFYITV